MWLQEPSAKSKFLAAKVIDVLQFLKTVPALRNCSTSDVSPKPLTNDTAAITQNPSQGPGRSLAH